MVVNLYRQSYYSYKALFNWLTLPSYIANVLLAPAIYVVIYAMAGRFARDQEQALRFMIGMSATGMPQLLMGGVLQNFANERSLGTLSFILASRVNRLANFLARGVFHLPNALLTVFASMFAAVIVLDADFGGANWPAVVSCYVLIAFSGTAFGLCLGNIAMALREWTLLYSLANTFFFSLTGAVIPRQTLPQPLYALSEGLPVSHALDGMRQAYDGAGFSSIGGELAAEALVAVVYAVVGYALFRAVEVYARRTGAYEAA